MGAKCQYCECDHVETGPCPTQQQIDDHDHDHDYDDDQDEFCGQCYEGYTYHCIDGCCINAEDGCDLCARRCDFCNPFKPTPKQAEESAELGRILGDALAKQKATP